MDGVTVASELVKTSYRCLRVLGDLHRIYATTPEPTNPLDFPWVIATVRYITQQVENLETHIKIALTTFRPPHQTTSDPESDQKP